MGSDTLDRIGQNGTYWYVPVRTGTTLYKSVLEFHSCTYRYVPVHSGMYRYIPVHTFNKTGCFQTHPERVRRDKIKVEQLLCMGYNVMRSNFKTVHVYLIASTYWYILVYTGTYR